MTQASDPSDDDTALRKPVSEREVAKSAGLAFIARLGAVIELVSQPAYTWLFSVPTYGVYTVLLAAVYFGQTLFDMGMGSALQRFVPAAKNEREAHAAVKIALLLSLVVSSLAALALCLSAPWIAQFVNASERDAPHLTMMIMLFAWALPLWTFLETAAAALRARRTFGAEIRLRIVYEQFLRLGLVLIVYLLGFRIFGLIVAHLLSLIIVTVLMIRLLGTRMDLKLLWSVPLDRTLAREMVGYGIALLPANVIRRVFVDLPPIILNVLLPGAAGATAAALYAIGRKIASVIQLFKVSFGYVMGPLASAQAAAIDTNAINPLYGFSVRLSAVLALPTVGFCLAMGDDLLMLFAPEARAAYWTMAALVIGRGIESLSGPAHAIQEVIGHRALPLINSLAGLLLLGPLVFWMTPQWGGLGMAIAVTIATNFVAYANLIQLHFTHNLNPFHPPFGLSLLVGMAGVAAMFGSHALGQAIPGGWAATTTIVLTPVILWCCLRFGLIAKDRQVLGKIGRRIRLTRL
jgi:O-antigen/teichoic acid export membrane protein